ncbi:hypothetical protein [Saccharopolyspora elongata]|uniref:Uncharacterized protein n=1 Tax=Saccharopolyspora elongata TaxID=2530387 RepID=A0A4R4Z288_9PSEU|nr:hypothetical protein [Saccharopolyspora elongata]TDD50152.1 hypothetical protein E1288_18265 [Saccharopolyspora elongata]
MLSTHDSEHVPEQPHKHENVQIVVVAQINAPWVSRSLVDVGALIRTPNAAAAIRGGLHVIADIVAAASKILSDGRLEDVPPEERPRLVVTAERADMPKPDARRQH